MTDATAPVLAEHIAGVNAFDEDAIADDALVNDVQREFWRSKPSAAGWPGNWSATA